MCQEEDRYVGVIAIEAAVRRAEVVLAMLAPKRKGRSRQYNVPGTRRKKLCANSPEAATGGNSPWRSWCCRIAQEPW